MRRLLAPSTLLVASLGLVPLLATPALGCGSRCSGVSTSQDPMPVPPSMFGDDGINFTTRAYWMRQANLALPNPCPFAAFGTVIVNHTVGGLGELVCTGANNNSASGNPALHGEIVAINNCAALFVDPQGPYRMTPKQALAAFANLTLYTNAESCPMCASAIRWAGFKEYIYGTSIDTLIEQGWGQIDISSRYVFEQSTGLSTKTRLAGPLLANETDVFFGWQFKPEAPCPLGCNRDGDQQGGCKPA